MSSIGGRRGWFVDAVGFTLRSGVSRHYGGPGGGVCEPFELHAGEYLLSVCQWHTGEYLGSRIELHTSLGRVCH